jgi:hypothetical protein
MMIFVVGCVTNERPAGEPVQVQHKLMGQTRQAVLACAGVPVRAYEENDTTELVYYREASLLEESFPGSKGSVARTHHGCRANVRFKGDRVTEVRYQSIPSDYHDEDHCDEIFELCAMSTSPP